MEKINKDSVSLREIKQATLLENESFTYMISSQEKTNIAYNISPIVWEFDFGGFEQPYDDYKVEVINSAHNGNILTSNIYLMLICDGLCDNGNFFRKKLTNRECVLSVLPLNAVTDAYIQSEGSSGTTFKVKNCRLKKRIKCYFLKPDFTTLTHETDINIPTPGPPVVANTTHWFLTMKMTPIIYN